MESNTSKALKGISSQAIVTILLGVLEIVSFSIMSRLLSQEDFGFFAAVTAIVTVFSSLSDNGIGSAIVQRKDITPKYINNAFTLSLFFGIASMLLLCLATLILPESVIDPKMRVSLFLMSVTLLLSCITSVFRSVLHKQLKFFTIGVVNLISLVVTTVLAIILALKGLGYYAIIAKAMLGSVISCIIFYILSKTHYNLAFDKATFRSIFSFSGWLMASRFFSDLSKQIDKLLMPKLMSIVILGAYTRPKDFVNTLSTKINGIFDTALFPVLSTIQDDRRALRNAYNKSLYTMNLFASLMTLAFVVNSKLIMRIFFGPDWLYLAPVLATFSLLFVFNANGRISDCYLRSLGRTKDQFLFRIVEFVTKTIGVVVGAHWGLWGVTIGVVAMDCLVKLVKIIYTGSLVSFSAGEVLLTISRSEQILIEISPVIVVAYFILPHTIGGEISLLAIFSLLNFAALMLFPKLVGKQYERDLYPIIQKYTNNVLKKVKSKKENTEK